MRYKFLLALFATIIVFFLNVNSDRKVVLTDINATKVIYLHKRATQEHVHSFRVRISGTINGVTEVTLHQSSPKGAIHRSANISGKVAIDWGGDWYTDTIVLVVAPVGKVSGSLTIEYRFDGI